MNTSTQSILLAAMLAVSGFAAAQNPAAPASRAEVKSQINQEGSAGDKRGQGPQIQTPGTGKASDNTRAEVKAQVVPEGSAGDKRGQGPFVSTPITGSSENSRAGVKAEIVNKGTSGIERGEGPMIDNKPKMASEERKAKRDERRAMAKAKRDAKMNSSGAPEPMTQKAP